ncbi:MAG TPA: hypothetical protein VE619_06945 [Nitrososphaeraceae archaeon]|nr:hypothetical protein [Nitrososphaeraceae archaeon]
MVRRYPENTHVLTIRQIYALMIWTQRRLQEFFIAGCYIIYQALKDLKKKASQLERIQSTPNIVKVNDNNNNNNNDSSVFIGNI